MNCTIRQYKSEDFFELKTLLSDVYESHVSKETLEKSYLSDTRHILVAIEDKTGKLIGCTFVEKQVDFIRSNSILYVTYVAVDEKFRKMGIGRKLLSRVEMMCIEQRCYAIELTSANFRTGAHAFYESLGFTEKKTKLYIKEMK